jgi:hypothetical protein
VGLNRGWILGVIALLGTSIAWLSFAAWRVTNTSAICELIDCSVLRLNGDDSRVATSFGDGLLTAALAMVIVAFALAAIVFPREGRGLAAMIATAALVVVIVAAQVTFSAYPSEIASGEPRTTNELWAIVIASATIVVLTVVFITAQNQDTERSGSRRWA